TKVNRKIHLLQNIMAQHFTFLSDPSIHAGLRATKGQKRQKSDKDGLTLTYRPPGHHKGACAPWFHRSTRAQHL
ncbi:MAG: hypothetical protein Q8Q81_17330, partial [Oxalobacteraceae bacterium]|nr:hypothetical protein [Oxalobacteraceae bacterium]